MLHRGDTQPSHSFVEDEMDEENLDDKEEQSEEGRAAIVGQRQATTPTLAARGERERTHIIEVGADIVLHGQAILLIEAESFSRRSEDDKDMKQVSYVYFFHARSAGIGISKDLGVERSSYWHGVCSCGATERSSH